MLGIIRRGDEERERERKERRRTWREKIARKYIIDIDHTSLHDDFCRAVLKNLPPNQVPQALSDLEHGIQPRAHPTIRCRIFGCVAQVPCALRPYCTDCQGRCTRCGRPVVPRAQSMERV